ncbi:DUF3419 family protein [Epibacterium ulvae]|uniref:DUF3419 family protein n=1 Tax=Epibacterium ulvae TaxID=1156985 RepID=UPI002491BB41|nr:DUF3419 family protein [Epibacterium ulvae]
MTQAQTLDHTSDQSIEHRIGTAVNQNAAHTREGLLERLFGWFFKGLVYAQIWEDPVADMNALQITEQDDLVCIASGGCNVMSYLMAQPASITAVDLSPAHVALNKLKVAAPRYLDQNAFYDLFGHANKDSNIRALDQHVLPHLDQITRAYWNKATWRGQRKQMFARGLYRHGLLGQFLKFAHALCWAGGVKFDKLLTAQSLDDQNAFFDQEIAPLYDSRFVRFLANRRASLFGLGIPPAQYDKLAADTGGDIIAVLRERTRKLFCDFPIHDNYFALQAANRGYKSDGAGPVPPYLEAQNFETLRACVDRVEVLNQSVTEMLAAQPEGSKSVYVLLDAQDWMNDDQLNDLWHQITRTARPGARVLFRTGGLTDILPGRVEGAILNHWRYDAEASTRATAEDRSAIYGAVHMYRYEGGA